MKRTIAALLMGPALWMSGCGDDPVTSPSTNVPAPQAPTSPAPSGGSVRGRIVDSVSGDAVPGARISGAGSESTTAADGSFSLDVASPAAITVVTEAEAHWSRRARVVAASEPVTIDILPADNEFNLEFFDHVFRDLGEEGTRRWLDEPRFEIWDKMYECTTLADNGGCDQLVATADEAPGQFVATMRGVIQNDSRSYTGGSIRGSFVETIAAHSVGTVIQREEYFEVGRITIAFVIRPDRFSWGFWRFSRAGAMTAGHIQINRQHRELRGVYSHELAHTLGFAHPLGLDNVPERSIMRQDHGDGPTRLDILHGRILYERPPGSRSPDDDPADFILNAVRDASAQRGELITRSAR